MKVSISGQHINLGASLQEYVQDKITYIVEKYFDHPISADVHFSKEGYRYVCHLISNEGTSNHHVMKSNASADEIYHSFDLALAKLEKQLRRYKNKIRTKSNRLSTADAIKSMSAKKYVISSTENEVEEGDNPAIIAEKPIEVLTLSVADAVMKMDLENLPALMFKNVNNDRINIVYYRKDGNISWVDHS